MGVDKMGVDKMGSIESGNKPNDRPLREFENAVNFRRSLNNVFVSFIR